MQLEQNPKNAREQMIGQQIRAWGVSNQSVLDTLRTVDREQYVPDDYKNIAFADWRVPLAHNEYMMTPKVEARMLQALNLQPNDKVFEVGTGSGYITACLAAQCKQVTTIDIHADFIHQAQQKFAANNIANIEAEQQSVFTFTNSKTFDAIAVTGSVPDFNTEIKTSWLRWLGPGGRLFVIVGQAPVMQAKLFTKINDGSASETTLFETDLPPLVGSQPPSTFEF